MDDLEEQLQSKDRLKIKTAPLKIAVVLCILLSLLIFTKNPGSGGPKLIIVFLLLIFCFLICIFSVFLQLIWLVSFKKYHLSWVKLMYSSVILAFGSVFLIGLQTLGQLKSIDVILITLFESIVLFYVLRRF